MQFTLDPRNLSIVDLAGDRRVSAGTYSLSVGGGQSGTVAPRAETEFRIKGDQKLPE
jgi:beta-glucosidase